MNKLSQFLKPEYIFQAFLIFLSVFLGTLMGNWNEKRKEQEKTKVFLEKYLKQLETNKELIKKTIPYHEIMRKTADSLLKNQTPDEQKKTLIEFGGLQVFPNWAGVQMAALDNSIYESGVVSGALDNVPIDLLIKINRIQSFQSEYIRFSRLLSEKLMSFGAETKTIEFIIFISILGSDTLILDKELVKAYEQMSKEIKKYSVE